MAKKGRAAVVVLGDIGRSPRMQYHALSLARQACLEVDVIAYKGTNPHLAVMSNPSIRLYTMKPIILQNLPKILYLLLLPLKTLIQFVMLLWFLCIKIPQPDFFLVQNPPSIPTLIAVKWASWWRQSKFIVDWHNFGYTLLGLSLGRRHIMVHIYRWCERHYGGMANASLCVTKAMQHELAQNWGIKQQFCMISLPNFFTLLHLERNTILDNDLISPYGINDCISIGNLGLQKGIANDNKGRYGRKTVFTSQTDDEISLNANRPALIVSSTSWTADEDFSMLLEAAIMYDRRVAAILNEDDSIDEEKFWMEMLNGKSYPYPRLLFIITGKGPEREKYENQIRKLRLKRVAFRTMWLSAEDYPLLLGSADLGVSLHTSSSGLDLPMKVVDMFGCGLPVCAVSFSCIEELVKVDGNGFLFSSSSELANELMMLFRGFPKECNSLMSLKSGALETSSSSRWDNEWEKHALPLITKLLESKS